MELSNPKLQANMLRLFEDRAFADLTLEFPSEGAMPIYCHRAVLAAHSEYFAAELSKGPSVTSLQFPKKPRRIMQQVVRFCYFGELDETLTPLDALDVIGEARSQGITAMGPENVETLVLDQLSLHNCVKVLLHEELLHHALLYNGVCKYVGANFFEIIANPGLRDPMIRGKVPQELLIIILQIVAQYAVDAAQVEELVRFTTEWADLDSQCDLLKTSKQWLWTGAEPLLTPFRKENLGQSEIEWKVTGAELREGDEDSEALTRYVVGEFFEWCVRLDVAPEGKVRLVYESTADATGKNLPRCINRFPAAAFAWQVVLHGEDKFHERPVFICFPEKVSLHWSTSIGVSLSELADTDELVINVCMTENPLVSLILYYFSSDLKNTVQTEDILNRLPHIEFRCVSSYHLVNPQGS